MEETGNSVFVPPSKDFISQDVGKFPWIREGWLPRGGGGGRGERGKGEGRMEGERRMGGEGKDGRGRERGEEVMEREEKEGERQEVKTVGWRAREKEEGSKGEGGKGRSK